MTTSTRRSECAYGKRIEDDIADDAVDDGGGADAESERDDRHGGETGRAAERSQRVADVPPGILKPERSSFVVSRHDQVSSRSRVPPEGGSHRAGQRSLAAGHPSTDVAVITPRTIASAAISAASVPTIVTLTSSRFSLRVDTAKS